MNILFFVVTLLMVLGMFSLSQLQKARSLEAKIYLTYFKAFRRTRGALVQEAYLGHSRKKDKKTTEEGTTNAGNPPSTAPPYFRKRFLGCREGRLNLFALLENSNQFPLLKKVASQYMEALYGHRPEYHPSLLDQILEKQREYFTAYGELAPFYKLFFKGKGQDDSYYTLTKGTKVYDPSKKMGIPPLGDMFTFEESTTPPVKFHYASLLLLATVFPPEFAIEIFEEEYKAQKEEKLRRSYLTKNSLSQKVSEKMILDGVLKIALLDFSSKKQTKLTVITDEKTRITLRVETLN